MTLDLTQRLSDATLGALELLGVYLGSTLGYYEALDRHGPLTPREMAERTNTDVRYGREWLEQQAVAGVLSVVDEGSSGQPDDRRFALPPEHRGALVDPVDGDHVAPFASMLVGITAVIDEVAEAYRTGSGVPYARYGSAFRKGQGDINRPAFSSDLVKEWIPAVPGLADRLATARVLDVGTGHGWSAIAVAAGWPGAEVIGVDLDEASIVEARRHAAQAGVDARFELLDDAAGQDLSSFGPVDVAFIMEALHDMARPVEVLSSVRAALAPGGVLIVADEAVAEHFTAPGDDLERMMYGWSITHCLPASRAEEGESAAIGTAIRPGTVAAIAEAAGFTSCDVVDVDAGFFRLYRLTP
jgi:SAM-dependent methyltransferase